MAAGRIKISKIADYRKISCCIKPGFLHSHCRFDIFIGFVMNTFNSYPAVSNRSCREKHFCNRLFNITVGSGSQRIGIIVHIHFSKRIFLIPHPRLVRGYTAAKLFGLSVNYFCSSIIILLSINRRYIRVIGGLIKHTLKVIGNLYRFYPVPAASFFIIRVTQTYKRPAQVHLPAPAIKPCTVFKTHCSRTDIISHGKQGFGKLTYCRTVTYIITRKSFGRHLLPQELVNSFHNLASIMSGSIAYLNPKFCRVVCIIDFFYNTKPLNSTIHKNGFISLAIIVLGYFYPQLK